MLLCTFRYRTAAHLQFMKAAAAQLVVSWTATAQGEVTWMSPDEAKTLFQKSLELPLEQSSSYSPSSADRASYLLEHHDSLTRAGVDPVEIVVTPDQSARTFGDWVARPYRMFVVAQTEHSVLLVSAESGLFTLGSRDEAGVVRITGFASDEALAEWVS